jgi:hypothetical protein
MSAWKDGELTYILRLLETEGNDSVPYEAVPSYLRTQSASARRDGKTMIANALDLAAIVWIKQNYSDAKRIIREAIHANA